MYSLDYIDISGCSFARVYNQNTVRKMAIFNLYARDDISQALITPGLHY